MLCGIDGRKVREDEALDECMRSMMTSWHLNEAEPES